MIVLTTTGWIGSPSVAISTSGCPWMVIWAGQTDAKALIILNLYLLPGVMVKVSKGVLVLNPVFGSCNRIAKLIYHRVFSKIYYSSALTVNCPLPLISRDSGSWPVFAANLPGNRSIPFSWSQSDNSTTCVVKS